jgi:hypothetical protein
MVLKEVHFPTMRILSSIRSWNIPEFEIMNQQYEVGDGISAANGSWTFGGNTTFFFDQHISKSVPFYRDGHNLVLQISDFFVKKNSICYELGVSTGSLSRQLAKRLMPFTKFNRILANLRI